MLLIKQIKSLRKFFQEFNILKKYLRIFFYCFEPCIIITFIKIEA